MSSVQCALCGEFADDGCCAERLYASRRAGLTYLELVQAWNSTHPGCVTLTLFALRQIIRRGDLADLTRIPVE